MLSLSVILIQFVFNLTNNQLRDCLTLLGLNNVINEPTLITKNSVSLSDPVIVSDTLDILDSRVIPLDRHVSDYRASYVSVRLKLPISNKYYKQVWNYKNADFTALNNLVEQFSWDDDINETKNQSER